MNFNLESCKYNFTSDNINIFVMIYDESGSMSYDVASMIEANHAFVQDFMKFEEKGSIAVAKASFHGRTIEMSDFSEIKNFSTAYKADGGTNLYEALTEVGKKTIEYYHEIVKRLNTIPRITFLVFSDGVDSDQSERELLAAKDIILQLNSLDATTVFVAFREARESGVPERLGFNCTKNIHNVSELISCMGGELSKSCKEQSQSAYSLKSAFFSKAAKESHLDNIEAAATEDDDFFNV